MGDNLPEHTDTTWKIQHMPWVSKGTDTECRHFFCIGTYTCAHAPPVGWQQSLPHPSKTPLSPGCLLNDAAFPAAAAPSYAGRVHEAVSVFVTVSIFFAACSAFIVFLGSVLSIFGKQSHSSFS